MIISSSHCLINAFAYDDGFFEKLVLLIIQKRTRVTKGAQNTLQLREWIRFDTHVVHITIRMFQAIGKSI